MSAIVKLVDFPLFLVFFVVALAAPLLDAQTCLPASYFPEALINFKEWYRQQYGDYLFSEKPNFFVGTVWLELVFQWPLALLNLYAILSGKPWFNTSCLIYGVSITSSMVVDFLLFLVFLVVAVAVPLLGAQTCLPASYFPEALINFKEWYRHEYGDYLFSEKPNFFVGTVWLELFFQWPLALLNIYAILCGKPWFNTSCLIYGVSITSSMVVPVLSELILSGKASDELLMLYAPFLGVGVVAMLRGFVPHSAKSGSGVGKRTAFGRKKRV
ncbi:unnamed protein product [Linum tenue]|uniref:EXPERA domain-containing protein n=1 Tax=Linum tenue TaxID=586396 RepID=A0AAV0NPY4_9ROSI|nr:unnamed protein product [Linum tenue]